MNDLMINNSQTVSSIDISVMTGKEHKNVLADCRKMLEELEINTAVFSAVRKAGNGRHETYFNLPKRECLILASGYSIKLRAKIIDRWAELESEKSSIPRNYPEALRLAASQAEQLQAQQAQIESDAPLVQFAKTIEGTSSKIPMGDMAKLSGKIGRNNLFRLLRENKILQANNRPYQRYITSGYFEVSERVIKMPTQDMVKFITYVTGKGQIWVNGKIDSWV